MPATLDAVAKDALVLSRDERLILARQLLVSVEPNGEEESEAAWEEEIGQRIHRFDAGFSQTVPASEVFARLADIAPGR
jgi:putative addiction module component (TIGR02574 family)